jgi:hypothetical protein
MQDNCSSLIGTLGGPSLQRFSPSLKTGFPEPMDMVRPSGPQDPTTIATRGDGYWVKNEDLRPDRTRERDEN